MKVQIFLTVNASKELIGRALAEREDILSTARDHTLVILKGTTNAFFARTLCEKLHVTDISLNHFYRGIIRPAFIKDDHQNTNDLIISKGKVLPEEDIFSIANQLTKDDIICKGANALNMEDNTCAVLIGNSSFGTMAPIINAHYGRRVKLIHPVGLEKRVTEPLSKLANLVNSTNAEGLRLAVSPGSPYTEFNAFSDLFHVTAHLIAAGGAFGYEGGCLFIIEGSEENIRKAQAFAKENAGLNAYPF